METLGDHLRARSWGVLFFKLGWMRKIKIVGPSKVSMACRLGRYILGNDIIHVTLEPLIYLMPRELGHFKLYQTRAKIKYFQGNVINVLYVHPTSKIEARNRISRLI